MDMVIERTNDTKRELDEITIDQCMTLYNEGLSFICSNGNIQRIVEE